MARRHDALIPLSHDHHHALAQARRLNDAARFEDDTDRRNVANDFVNFHLGRGLRHFHDEEELFFAPLVDDEKIGPLITQAVADHLRLHAKVRTLQRQLSSGTVEPNLLKSIGETFTSHVRFEEQELFPLIESAIPEEDLVDLAIAGRRDV